MPCQNTFFFRMTLTFDLKPWPSIPGQPRSRPTLLPKILVVGQTIQKLEHKHADATKHIISLASQSIKMGVFFFQILRYLGVVYLFHDFIHLSEQIVDVKMNKRILELRPCGIMTNSPSLESYKNKEWNYLFMISKRERLILQKSNM